MAGLERASDERNGDRADDDDLSRLHARTVVAAHNLTVMVVKNNKSYCS